LNPLFKRKSFFPVVLYVAILIVLLPQTARASIFEGETLDSIANAIAWIALIIAPLIGIVVFWLVHILPEKIAEKRHHPQAQAIQTLCLLSLVFGGLLWPIAWLWAYSKPVFYKMAYGTDVEEHGHGEEPAVSDVNPEGEVRHTQPHGRPTPADLEVVPSKGGRG
jgi:CBS domain containing-hemolysin-like protein